MGNCYKFLNNYMNFKNWIIKEMGHTPVSGIFNNKKIEIIDPRFEFYPDKETYQSGQQPWAGKLPNGKWLINHPSENGHKAFIVNRLPSHSTIPYYILPKDWFDYARIGYADGTWSIPKKP